MLKDLEPVVLGGVENQFWRLRTGNDLPDSTRASQAILQRTRIDSLFLELGKKFSGHIRPSESILQRTRIGSP
eukprot:7902197-Lingulodinium_polyedra.AAC.1